MYPDSMQPPVDGTRFFLRLLVEPEARLRGVGRTLVCAAAAYARESGAMRFPCLKLIRHGLGSGTGLALTSISTIKTPSRAAVR